MIALGNLYLKIHEPAKALAMFKKSQLLLPADRETRVNEAIAHRMNGDTLKAVTILKSIVKKFDSNDPWSVKGALLLLECLHDVGDTDGIKKQELNF